MAEASTLYVVATPIGNLRDVTLRALDVLRSVNIVAAEDTRHTRRLLDHYGIDVKLVAAHEHNERMAAAKVVEWLRAGQSVALVTDAGTPAVSDPGASLVHDVRAAGCSVVPIPGPSAVVTALSAAGIEGTAFLFGGFLPAKSEARRAAIEVHAHLDLPVLFYEAPHRVRDSVEDLLAVLGPERRITLARELTKVFESIHECALGEAIAWMDADPNHARGEFVLILHAALSREADAQAQEALRVVGILMRELPISQAAKLAAQITGARRNDLYDAALRLKQAEQAPET